MIYIPYDFNGSVNLVRYSTIVSRVREFDDYENIGKDESGSYDMYIIHLGDKSKPTIFVDGAMHGTEWQGAIYSLEFFKQLKDNTFPDKKLRNRLLNEFHLVLLPVMNPWGFDRTTSNEPKSRNRGRRNSNDVDLNGDFNAFTQQESINTKNVLDDLTPFAYLNCHLQTLNMPRNQGNNLIVGNGQGATNYVKEDWIESLQFYSGEAVTNWAGFTNLSKGLSRRYVRDLKNPYTPNTLSYITEMMRPQQGKATQLSSSELYKYGMANVYLFFVTSLKYFDEQVNNIPYDSSNDDAFNDEVVKKIIMPNKTYEIERNESGEISEILEKIKSGETYKYTFTKKDGFITEMNKEKL